LRPEQENKSFEVIKEKMVNNKVFPDNKKPGQVEYSQVSSPTCLGFSTTPTIPLIILVIVLYSFFK
jgi:preprotein translocase subunit Sss1